MNCLRCNRQISDTFFSARDESPEFKGGRFACPHCGAEHLRRNVGTLASGEPLFSFRLWGHLRVQQKALSSEKAPGTDRRKSARSKSWR